MTQKKSPRCVAAVGADQKGGKEFLASSDLATSIHPAQAECCANCQFFRRVALPSGHDRLWCDLFAAGSWDETWADPTPEPQQSWLCRVCRHGIVPSFRAAVIGLVGCRSHYLPDGRGWPVLCPGFKVKEGCHAA